LNPLENFTSQGVKTIELSMDFGTALSRALPETLVK
jgi:hypothetical protein